MVNGIENGIIRITDSRIQGNAQCPLFDAICSLLVQPNAYRRYEPL